MYQRIQPFVEIMDSTLRDGEQTSGVSFLPHEKLIIARMLLRDLNVDRIEVASARVSEGEKEAVSMICRYAQQIDIAISHMRRQLDRRDRHCSDTSERFGTIDFKINLIRSFQPEDGFIVDCFTIVLFIKMMNGKELLLRG